MSKGWITLPGITKKGEDLGYHYINLDNIIYWREFVEKDKPISKENPGKTIGYAIGGKDTVIPIPLHELIEEINQLPSDTKQKIRLNNMLSGNKKNNKATNQSESP